MSSILKALKKLEEEKTARRNGGMDVAKGILKSNPGQNEKSGWMLPVSVAGSAMLAALLTYFLTTGHTPAGRKDVPAPTGKAESDTIEKKAPVPASEPVISEIAPQSPHGTAAATAVNPVKKKETIRVVRVPAPAKPPARWPNNRDSAPTLSEAQSPGASTRMIQKNAAESARPSDVHSVPALRVTGIAWNRDNSERLAVVNGMPVSEGSTIEGARVEVIMKDKVRFSFEKKTFDVAVGN